MATQPIDRKNMKHASKVAKRVAPQLVNRSNKQIAIDLGVRGPTARSVAQQQREMDRACEKWGRDCKW